MNGPVNIVKKRDVKAVVLQKNGEPYDKDYRDAHVAQEAALNISLVENRTVTVELRERFECTLAISDTAPSTTKDISIGPGNPHD